MLLLSARRGAIHMQARLPVSRRPRPHTSGTNCNAFQQPTSARARGRSCHLSRACAGAAATTDCTPHYSNMQCAALLGLSLAAAATAAAARDTPRVVSATGPTAGRDVLVGAHYFAGWSRDCVLPNGSSVPGCYSHFHGYTPTGAPVANFFASYPSRVPLLGNFTTDVATVAREVHAADAAGLDFFDLLYYDGGADCGMPPAGDAKQAAAGTAGPDPGLRWCLDTTLAFMLNSSEVWDNTTGRLHFYLTYSNDIDANTPNAFVGPAGRAKWDALVRTWTTAMTHRRYLRVGGRPVFKVLIPDVFLDVECGSNATLASELLDSLRAAAVACGAGKPLVGASWYNPSTPVLPPPPPLPTGFRRYPSTFVNCSSHRSGDDRGNRGEAGCTIRSAVVAGTNSTVACEALCNGTATCVAVQVAAAGSNSTNCSLLSVVGPGAPRDGVDTYVRQAGAVHYDFSGTYNSAPPVCPGQPNWQCPRYQNSWWPNATATGAKVFPYAECADYQTAARLNHTADVVPYLPNVIAGFDPRPWEEHSPSFSMPSQAEWELALRQVKAQVQDPSNRFGFPDPSAPGGVQPAFTIYAWNEYGEGGILAPTAGEGFMKLQAISAVFNRSVHVQAAGGL